MNVTKTKLMCFLDLLFFNTKYNFTLDLFLLEKFNAHNPISSIFYELVSQSCSEVPIWLTIKSGIIHMNFDRSNQYIFNDNCFGACYYHNQR